MVTTHPQSPLLKIFYFFARSRNKSVVRKGKKKEIVLEKRQKFAIGIVALSLGLFFAEYVLNTYGILIAVFLAIISNAILYWAIYKDLKDNFSIQVFILPFLYSLSFGLFSFLTPARLFTRVILVSLYALGLYSVFLSENIFVVASIRTIALLNSARIVSLVISLITFFFLASTALSLRLMLLPTIIGISFFSMLLTIHALWTYTLEADIRKDFLWVVTVTLCILQLSCVLWFWPTSSTILSLFLTSIWYVLTGLMHVWFDKRLFRNVLWEYIWVAVVAFLVLISFTKWQ